MSVKIDDPIHISELDFRVQSINKGKYATILVYKDARVDINRLNKVYGAGNWQRKHEVVNGNMFCSVGVYHEHSKSWAWVQDCGTESMAEKEKGQASDSFKRACFNLGIGIELYDYPIISVQLKDHEYFENDKKKDRYGNPTIQASFGFKLKEWVWDIVMNDDKKILSLTGKDERGNLRFKYPNDSKQQKPEINLAESIKTDLFVLESCKTLEELKKAWNTVVNKADPTVDAAKERLKTTLK